MNWFASSPRFFKRAFALLLDILICIFSVYLTFGLLLNQWWYFQENQWAIFLLSITLSLPLLISFGLYRAIYRYIGKFALASIVRVFIFYAPFFFLVCIVIDDNSVPLSIGIIQPCFYFIGICASRYIFRYLSEISSFKMKAKYFCIIFGAGSAGHYFTKGLSGTKEFSVKCFVDDDPRLHGSTINGIFVYPSSQLKSLIILFKITDVLLAIPSANQHRIREIIILLNGCGVRVRKLTQFIKPIDPLPNVNMSRDLNIDDLLEREIVSPKVELLEKNILNQVVLVTGAGGSIGSELCRQIVKFSPKLLILVDACEATLHLIYEELKISSQDVSSNSVSLIQLVPCLVSVRDRDLLLKIFKVHQPTIVFHAAAYKHVPLLEQNPVEGIRNNVFGTLTCAQVSIECGVSHFILVSTDKAVRPTNVMGVSKRISELVLQSISEVTAKSTNPPIFSMVRFGNVLGSSGSVVPLFISQIATGGPITLTHPDVTRYFMTIPEAAQLVIQASSMAVGGDVFILDMGKPVRIYDLAVKLVYLSGLLIKNDAHPHGDIEIKLTGLRPGEKLYEELLIGDNPQPTPHPKILKSHEEFFSWMFLQQELEKLNLSLDAGDMGLVLSILKKLVPSYRPNDDAAVWNEAASSG